MDETKAEAAAAAPESAPARPLPDIDAAIERWFDDHFPGSPVSQLTAAWNTAIAAKEELKRRLSLLIGGGQ